MDTEIPNAWKYLIPYLEGATTNLYYAASEKPEQK
jgi:hypothetical protein